MNQMKSVTIVFRVAHTRYTPNVPIAGLSPSWNLPMDRHESYSAMFVPDGHRTTSALAREMAIKFSLPLIWQCTSMEGGRHPSPPRIDPHITQNSWSSGMGGPESVSLLSKPLQQANDGWIKDSFMFLTSEYVCSIVLCTERTPAALSVCQRACNSMR